MSFYDCTISNREGWVDSGWYTITRGTGTEDWTSEGAVWIDLPEGLDDDLEAARGSVDCPEVVAAWYHGNGPLPDECMSEDVNEWLDFDPTCVTDQVWYLAMDIADAKCNGTNADVEHALDALRAID